MSYVSHQSIGYSQKLESPILHNIFCLVFRDKGNWSIKKKKSLKTDFKDLEKS